MAFRPPETAQASQVQERGTDQCFMSLFFSTVQQGPPDGHPELPRPGERFAERERVPSHPAAIQGAEENAQQQRQRRQKPRFISEHDCDHQQGPCVQHIVQLPRPRAAKQLRKHGGDWVVRGRRRLTMELRFVCGDLTPTITPN